MMTAEHQESLRSAYPGLFRDADKNGSLMRFGIEVDDGWFHVVDDLFAYLSGIEKMERIALQKKTLSDWAAKLYVKIRRKVGFGFPPAGWYFRHPIKTVTLRGPKVTLAQVKEKFGTLRVYYDLDWSDSASAEDLRKISKKEFEGFKSLVRSKIGGAIAYAEFLSSRTCEMTGTTGMPYTKFGWRKTLCRRLGEGMGYTPADPLDL